LKARIEALPTRPGVIGAHLLQHQAPPIAPTTEQQIRGLRDQVADWVLVACGYDLAAIQGLANGEFGEHRLRDAGAAEGTVVGLYAVAHSATPRDIG